MSTWGPPWCVAVSHPSSAARCRRPGRRCTTACGTTGSRASDPLALGPAHRARRRVGAIRTGSCPTAALLRGGGNLPAFRGAGGAARLAARFAGPGPHPTAAFRPPSHSDEADRSAPGLARGSVSPAPAVAALRRVPGPPRRHLPRVRAAALSFLRREAGGRRSAPRRRRRQAFPDLLALFDGVGLPPPAVPALRRRRPGETAHLHRGAVPARSRGGMRQLARLPEGGRPDQQRPGGPPGGRTGFPRAESVVG